jgi:lysophospholipase L1-like esterase
VFIGLKSKLIKLILTAIGAILIATAPEAEWLGSGYLNFNNIQRVLILAGVGVVVLSLALPFKTINTRLTAYTRILAIASVWLIILVPGLVSAELYTRHTQGYWLWSWPLQKSYFFEPDRVKIYNKQFVNERQAYFREWPIPLELFEANKPVPRYLFKPNLRMARDGNKLVQASPGDEVIWSSNAWGFRGPEISVEKPPGVIRIVCLGASTTEGSQKNTETYPYFLQQELNRLFPNQTIEVINAGHHGQDIFDLLEILNQRVLPLQPDIVLFYEGSNNINFYDFVEGLPCTLGECWLNHYPAWYRFLYKHSAIFVLLSDSFGWNSYKPPPMPHKFDDTGIKPSALYYREGLYQIARETQARGGIIVLSSFITVAHEELEVAYEDNPGLFNDIYKKYYPLTPAELGRIYDHFNRQSARAREFGVPYADVAAKFPKDARYFPFDLIHFSPEGNQLLAKLFAEFLATEVLPGVIEAQKIQPES